MLGSNFECGLLSFRLSLLFAFALRKLDMAQFNRALEEYLWGSFTDGIPDDSAQCLGQPESAACGPSPFATFAGSV